MSKTNPNQSVIVTPRSLAQPKAMYLLFFVQMWESFSYYGMRTILVLYMVSTLKFDDDKAFGIYAMYAALAECLGIFGGRMADKIFGLQYSIYLGGIMMAIGHLILSLPIDGPTLYLSLAFIAVGTGLFRTNCTALLGEFYTDNDPRREAGYILFYVGLNFGAVLATILCAYAAESQGWHAGFSFAAIGMLLGLLCLFRFNFILEKKGQKPPLTSHKKIFLITMLILLLIPFMAILIYTYQISAYLLLIAIFLMLFAILQSTKRLPKREKQNIISILITVFMLAVFFGFAEQIGSAALVFAERFADRDFFGFNVPVTSLTTINPLAILIMGPFVALFLELYEAKYKCTVNIFSKIIVAFLLQAIAYAYLYISMGTGDFKVVSAYTITWVFGLIGFAELFIGPAVYGYCSEISPRHMRGVLMGTVMLGYALANLLGGFVSQLMATDEHATDLQSLQVYSSGFSQIAISCLVFAVVVYIVKKARKNFQ